MGDGEVAAGRHGVHDPGHDRVRVVGVRDRVQDREQRDRHRAGEVQQLRAAWLRIVAVSRRSASMYSVAPASLLVSRARAWASTIGS